MFEWLARKYHLRSSILLYVLSDVFGERGHKRLSNNTLHETTVVLKSYYDHISCGFMFKFSNSGCLREVVAGAILISMTSSGRVGSAKSSVLSIFVVELSVLRVGRGYYDCVTVV